ncbi:MAG: 3-phosphoserine/phosphohydroxythreonine transaminase [Clostridia bacterium]|nr:3-phosphoserine/phosphohydroxythreonine transaminase [Clostridia bacterium]
MRNIYNFSAGPAMLPDAVLAQAAAEMQDYNGTGQSVLELSHRSADWQDVMDEAELRLRRLMRIPAHYTVLFLQGGASAQFAMVPLNLMRNGKADYLITGLWAKKAYREAMRYGAARVICSSEAQQFTCIPEWNVDLFDPAADYVHLCMNNTIYGTMFHTLPDTGSIPLVADISSCILSQPMDVSRFGLLYAGAQKNMGPAGVTVVIVRSDLLERVRPDCPTLFRYRTHADHGSMYNTPPCYAIYVMLLVLRWLEDTVGGLESMAARNRAKAQLLYDYLDESALFRGTAAIRDRSWMNVPFITGDAETDARFLREASDAGLVNLAGHRTVGGMRASLYNAMPVAGIQRLTECMADFERRYA